MKKILYILIVLILMGINSFAQWEHQPSGTTNNLTSVYFIDADTGHSVGVWADTVLITTDGGTTWNNQVSGTPHSLNSVFFTDIDTGYAVGDSGSIIKTVNGGTTWTTQVSGTTSNLLSVGFFNADTGYAISYDTLLKTTDGGGTWTAKPTSGYGGFPIGGGSGFFTDVNTGYQVRYESTFGLHGIISKTDDGGNNWWDYWVGTPMLGVYFPDDSIGYAVGGYNYISGESVGIILKTTNRGGTWTEQSAPTNYPLRSVFFIDANTGYVVGDSGTILKTTNGGNLWTSQTTGTFLRLLSIHFTDADRGYVVGDSGIILKTTNGGITGVNNQPSTSNSLKIYPNPSHDNVTIETTGNGLLSILNLNGQELITRQITETKTLVDIGTMPGGIYFLRVTGDKTVQMGKFIKE